MKQSSYVINLNLSYVYTFIHPTNYLKRLTTGNPNFKKITLIFFNIIFNSRCVLLKLFYIHFSLSVCLNDTIVWELLFNNILP